jgi:integrase
VLDRTVAGGVLLFPSCYKNPEAPMKDLRDLLDRVAKRAGFPKGRIRPRMLRVTYCSARLQTLDGGRPIAKSTVAGELGHHSSVMVETVYTRIGTMRHRSEDVEYRFDQHFERRGDAIVTRAGSTIVAPLALAPLGSNVVS